MDHIVKTVGLILSVAFQAAKLTEETQFLPINFAQGQLNS